ncbi:hypothetical protein N7U66_08225 [Lacinutrix neustonica]|uniref:Uncharacterized protein n=1 Tax=Lacinutrix neustonica TaxID=2980107 RepID=A0A9E8MZQ1_9FLAO|nr:hypothetical protein [Lacinutrix neustonica]WAC03462.1 hypothetical protein N7U66_08225 [Lacinutrix neustonica]
MTKGSEHLQLEYDVQNNTLNRVLVNIKRLNKEEKAITAFYNATKETITKNPKTLLSGSIDISNGTIASALLILKWKTVMRKKY